MRFAEGPAVVALSGLAVALELLSGLILVTAVAAVVLLPKKPGMAARGMTFVIGAG